MVVGILAEKPSAARHLAAALGGVSGSYRSEQFIITHARGHLYEFADPHTMVSSSPSLTEKYKQWDLAHLPWNPKDLDWKLTPVTGSGSVAQGVLRQLRHCTEIAIATDVDPTGEGGLIAVNAVLELGLKPTTWSRMYFTDESVVSLQKAFTSRKAIPSLQDLDEYKKARYRAQFDFLSMQFTRIATSMARASGRDAVLRQGRLKSAMVKLVGDQLKALDDYVKKPFFQNRFRDENDVMYVNPDEPRFDQKSHVPQRYDSSPVVLDTTTAKRTAPPRLLDLASLSSVLVDRNIKAKLVLATYQTMYEHQVVSYPRTADKTITPEQFDELAPLVDSIADVVGVDTDLLTHRRPRTTHVKPQGAHGANRPGPKVPVSLDAVESTYGIAGRLIYETLAKNYLAMLAEDYVYEQQKGHVGRYPVFVGMANVPRSPGWKLIFDPDAVDTVAEGEERNSNVKGLGRMAEPFTFEGANKRPEHPSMRWLMKQLDKRDVGTGATRTSTYSDVTSTTAKYPLLVERGHKLHLADAGEMSWHLLPGTKIGDLTMTEKVHADMRDIAAGRATADERLEVVADWVVQDMATMQKNATTMRSALGLRQHPQAARAQGTWQMAPGGPRKVTFKKTWSDHVFSEDEISKLLMGDEISFQAKDRHGNDFAAHGRLGLGTYRGRKFIGFQPETPDRPTTWCGKTFTPAEVEALEAGQSLEIGDFISPNSGRSFGCSVSWDPAAKKIVPDFGSRDQPPWSWCGVQFTDAQRRALAAGETVEGTGFVSKGGRKFDARVTWKDVGGKKKLVPSFD
ncbi:type IA DNA topoisomerase [Amycolatopsis sp. TNS106]|uniref:type IA DNA topoisomerase n=1 Tax=Amycolatopsis sp. TNS106 TaxID=2861750 RepID=UPI001C565D98|nr:type IA DNA topoisomerase [Amycolatopsis sp. TNS106]QXV57532.1 DNA topoisomerase I [Amycolatopsis sp. TNS106]